MEYHEVADQIRRHTKQLQAFEEAAKLLTEMGSLEQALRERRAAAEKLDTDLKDARQRLDAAAAAASEREAEATATVQRAQEEARRIVAEARAAAQTEARGITTAAEADVEIALRRRAGLEAEAATVKATLEATRTELADVENRLAEAKASVRQVLGQVAS